MIGIRLDEEAVERLDALVAKLGTTRPKLIKNLVSGDAALVNLISEKAKELNQFTLQEAIAKEKKRQRKKE